MARAINRLSATKVASLSVKGLYPDGAGLYLQVSPTKAKSWIFRYRRDGRVRDMGLGPVYDVTLARARSMASDCRRQLREGIDPIEARRASQRRARLADARNKTFDDCTTAFLASHQSSWRNPKHRQQWTNTMATYASPIIGSLPVAEIDTDHVVQVLEPMWQRRSETAKRLRQRIERVLDWARVKKFRDGENPARWRGHLDHLLPKIDKRRTVKHHSALPFAEINAFLAGLREEVGLAARALELTILTAKRTGEVLGARWDEIDFENRLWSIPGERTKSGIPSRVPLSGAAIRVLLGLVEIRRGDFVFPGNSAKRPLSNMAMAMLLRRMQAGITTHGFRSTFRDWVAERTTFAGEIAEMALGHTVESEVEAAYRRGDLFDKRRELMDAWAEYCGMHASPSIMEFRHLAAN